MRKPRSEQQKTGCAFHGVPTIMRTLGTVFGHLEAERRTVEKGMKTTGS